MSIDLLVVPSLVVAAVATVGLWLRVRAARAAGASEARPCCTRCWYPLGSWSESKCPECGADARVLGVATGARFGRVLALMLALCAGVAVFSVGHALARAFDGVAVEAQRWTWISGSSGTQVRFEANYGGPLRHDGLRATWFQGRLGFWPPKSTSGEPTITILVDGSERTLAIDDVRRALIEVRGEVCGQVGESADAAAIDGEARALHQMAGGLQLVVLGHVYEDGPLWSGVAPIDPWGQLSSDGEFTPSPSTLGVVFAALAAIAVLGFGHFVAFRCIGWGTRRAREGEWVTVGRDGVGNSRVKRLAGR